MGHTERYLLGIVGTISLIKMGLTERYLLGIVGTISVLKWVLLKGIS
jgi:hypothetical protein